MVTGFGAEVGAPLVEHLVVSKISFTGSDLQTKSVWINSGAVAGNPFVMR